MVPQTCLHIPIGLVNIHRLGCSRQIHHTLSQDHLLNRGEQQKNNKNKTMNKDRNDDCMTD